MTTQQGQHILSHSPGRSQAPGSLAPQKASLGNGSGIVDRRLARQSSRITRPTFSILVVEIH